MSPEDIAAAKRNVAVSAERYWWISRLRLLMDGWRLDEYSVESKQQAIRELEVLIAERER